MARRLADTAQVIRPSLNLLEGVIAREGTGFQRGRNRALGLVIAGNLAMVFAFWELVGICSYFLIGFYIERRSACNAANKAFIVNRIGDFGMMIGLMALWGGLGTFAFGDVERMNADGSKRLEQGIFSLVRSGEHYSIRVPDGLVRLSARGGRIGGARLPGGGGFPEAGHGVRRSGRAPVRGGRAFRRWALCRGLCLYAGPARHARPSGDRDRLSLHSNR